MCSGVYVCVWFAVSSFMKNPSALKHMWPYHMCVCCYFIWGHDSGMFYLDSDCVFVSMLQLYLTNVIKEFNFFSFLVILVFEWVNFVWEASWMMQLRQLWDVWKFVDAYYYIYTILSSVISITLQLYWLYFIILVPSIYKHKCFVIWFVNFWYKSSFWPSRKKN